MLRLPEKLRTELSKPYGKLYRNGERVFERIEELNKCKILACVGDLVAFYALKFGLEPDIIVIDGKTLRERQLKFEKPERYELLEVENPAGFISCSLVEGISKAVENALNNKKTLVFVKGEEDLAVMPLGVLLPLESLIIYGQPKEGVVALLLDEEKKLIILRLLKQMEVLDMCEEFRKLGVI